MLGITKKTYYLDHTKATTIIIPYLDLIYPGYGTATLNWVTVSKRLWKFPWQRWADGGRW